MVIVKLQGGIGNQMFQYAAGWRLAFVLGTQLNLDTTSFDKDNLRRYSLGYFSVQNKIATLASIARFDVYLDTYPTNLWSRLKRRIARHQQQSIYREETLKPVNLEMLKATGNIYLDGYWQSEKYFEDVRDFVRQIFTLDYEKTSLNRELASLMSSTDSVSLHVRRGDYVDDKNIDLTHGVCSMDYYHRCVDKLTQYLSQPHFFVFSDDQEWVRANLKLKHKTTYVDHNKGKDFEDLALMRQCRNHIIANSSFSWWGAWLNPNPDKLVFAPSRWFNDPTINTRDLIPEEWTAV